MWQPVIQTQGLTRDFGPLRALDSLTLGVPEGAVFGFLGPNGSGKTTTIRLLTGLLRATRGTASVLGLDVTKSAATIRSRVGVLLEHTGLYEKMSAEDNLEYFGRIARMPDAARKQQIRESLSRIGLWERRAEAVARWSRGMKQSLAVAVFLDEPTAGLDPIAAAALRDQLSIQAKGEGTTIFLTSHNLAEVEKLCDRVAVIHKGHLLAEGTPEGLRRSAASANGQQHATLEEVFMALVREAGN